VTPYRSGNLVIAGLVIPFVKVGPQRIAAFRALWRAVTQARKPGAPGVGERVSALPRLVRAAVAGHYPQLSRGRLGLILLGLAYLVSPIDLVPEAFVALLGLGDDAVVALWLGGAFLAETDRFLTWERQQPTMVDQHRVDQPPA
jgi:uncharacterized membrane protein YkvA (DUF1232 family)